VRAQRLQSNLRGLDLFGKQLPHGFKLQQFLPAELRLWWVVGQRGGLSLRTEAEAELLPAWGGIRQIDTEGRLLGAGSAYKDYTICYS